MYQYLLLKPKNMKEYTESDSNIKINSFIDYYQGKLAVKFNIQDKFIGQYYPIILEIWDTDNWGNNPGEERILSDYTIVRPGINSEQWDYKTIVTNKNFVLRSNTDYYIVYNGDQSLYGFEGFNLVIVGESSYTPNFNGFKSTYYSNMISLPVDSGFVAGVPGIIDENQIRANRQNASLVIDLVAPSQGRYPITSYNINRIITLGNKQTNVVDAKNLALVNGRVGPFVISVPTNTTDSTWTFEIYASNQAGDGPVTYYVANVSELNLSAGTLSSSSLESILDLYPDQTLRKTDSGILDDQTKNKIVPPKQPIGIGGPFASWSVINNNQLQLSVFPNHNTVVSVNSLLSAIPLFTPNQYKQPPGYPLGPSREYINNCVGSPQQFEKIWEVDVPSNASVATSLVDITKGMIAGSMFSPSKVTSPGIRTGFDNTIFFTETKTLDNGQQYFVKTFDRHEISNLNGVNCYEDGVFSISDLRYGIAYQVDSTYRYKEYGCFASTGGRLQTGKSFDRVIPFRMTSISSLGSSIKLSMPLPNDSSSLYSFFLSYGSMSAYEYIPSVNSSRVFYASYAPAPTIETAVDPNLRLISEIKANSNIGSQLINGVSTNNNCVNCLGFNDSKANTFVLDLGAVLPIKQLDISLSTPSTAVIRLPLQRRPFDVGHPYGVISKFMNLSGKSDYHAKTTVNGILNINRQTRYIIIGMETANAKLTKINPIF